VDIAVTETRHFPATNTHPGETCWKLEQGWFWDEGAEPLLTAGQIARGIHTAHSRNANFLLNVGPDKQGRIIDASRKILAEIPASRRHQP
jgi:alpha-L-fucosidase